MRTRTRRTLTPKRCPRKVWADHATPRLSTVNGTPPRGFQRCPTNGCTGARAPETSGFGQRVCAGPVNLAFDAFASLFHQDGIWILWTGQVWKGRTAIEDGHAAVHKTVFRNSVQRERLEELTFVGPDAAVVRFYSTLTGDERSPDKVVRSRKVLIVTRRNGVWKIGWGQNTRLADTTPD